jgi:hypothetical protein
MKSSTIESITHHIKITLTEDEYFPGSNSFLSNVLNDLGWVNTTPAVTFKSEVDIEALTTPMGFEGPMGLPMPNMMSRIGLFINENGGKPAFGIDPDKSLEKQLTAMGYLVETVYTTGPVRVISWPK